MKHWLVSDMHFGHQNLTRLCGRPTNFSERIHNNLLQIPAEDVLICLGDVCMGQDAQRHEEYVQQWPVKTKILVRGNHDKQSLWWYMHHGWTFACDQLGIEMYGKKVLLSHRPMALGEFDLNIHGHFHNSTHRRGDIDGVERTKRHQLIAMEFTAYRPILLRTAVVVGCPVGKTLDLEGR
jgi:calcineurin-like phosphoesterase family protein